MANVPGSTGGNGAAPGGAPQRAYRAACPNCGAPVDFISPASAFAVCSFCRSQVVRDGEALRRIGQGAELFDDHSPLQLGASGRAQGAAFTLVGRLQVRYAEGTWNEWHALFDNGRSGWLSEDNGRYVIAFDAPLTAPVPAADALRPGARIAVEGEAWQVASVVVAKLIAAQGELPATPPLERGFVVADLRNAAGEVGTLDYGDPASPHWSVGRSVALADLALAGLAPVVAEKALTGRTLNCPGCGSAVEVKLSGSLSVVCGQCRAVIDLSQGIGAALAHYAQEEAGAEPLIPLGSIGNLAIAGRPLLPWQVVGYVERCDVPESSDDEQGFWREYLLYHRNEGFAFLVDSEDGWSWVAPITGVPEGTGEVVRYQGVAYKKLYAYKARVTWVLGEFYWKVERNQETFNTDFQGTGAGRARRLNREESRVEGAAEAVWAAGEAVDVQTVRRAFRLPEQASAALGRDASPLAGIAGALGSKAVWWIVVLAFVFIAMRCSEDDCDDERLTFGEASQEFRSCMASRASGSGSSRGGSFGGFSGGGGHK